MPTPSALLHISSHARILTVAGTVVAWFAAGTSTAQAQSLPPTPTPCPGPGCVSAPPHPTVSVPAPPPPAPSAQVPSFWSNPDAWVGHLLTDWMWQFFASMVHDSLTGVLGLFARSVLATPQLALFPALGQVWSTSQQIVVAVYGLVVVAGGFIVMGYQTMQTRTSLKEILPRLVIGFLAANLSLLFIRNLIDLANGFSKAILGDDLGMAQACQILMDTLTGNLPGANNQGSPFYVLFTALALVVMLIAVILTYVVRVMATVVLACASPLALMCHGTPQTEKIAFWWWKAFTGVLLIQIVQSITLIATVKLFFLPGGINLF